MTEDSGGTRGERDARWSSLMEAAQRGERDPYERLLTELVPFVRHVVRERVGDQAGVEDIVQEVLMSIHAHRHTYRPERPLRPWVRAISRNAAIDWGRRDTRQRRRSSDVDVDLVEGAVTPDTRQALSPPLRRAPETLPDAQREAVLLLKVEGLSVLEAAERLGVTSGAVKLRAHRGYRALRTVLGEERL